MRPASLFAAALVWTAVVATAAQPPLPCVISLPPPLSTHGIKAEYYRGWVLHGYPDRIAAVTIDPDIAFSEDGTPGTRPWRPYPRDQFGRFEVRWTAAFTAPVAGTYRFSLDLGDRDVGTLVVDNLNVNPAALDPIDLAQGIHFLEVYYSHDDGYALARLQYQPPAAGGLSPIPANLLSPSVVFGPNTRTLTADRLAVGEAIVDQFTATDGLTFVPSATTPDGSYASRPTALDGCPKPFYNDSFDANTGRHDAPGRQPLTITFARPQSRVKVLVGTLQNYIGTNIRGGPNPPATLWAYNLAGALVAADHIDAVSRPVTTVLEVARWRPDIAGITITFDATDISERVASISFEGAGPVTVPDTTPPVVDLTTPREDESVPGPQTPVRAVVTDNSGLIDSAAAGSTVLTPDTVIDSNCRPPFCKVFTGVVNAPLGPNTLTVRARDHAGNLGSKTVHFAVGTTHIHVTNDAGLDVEGAEVYLDGAYIGSTDFMGRLDRTPAFVTGRLTARWLIATMTPFDVWGAHVYFTNIAVNDDGTTAAFTITHPDAVQELRVSRSNVLIGLHFVASLDWDASMDEMDDFATRARQTSQFLYNATDGQIYIESYELYDDAFGWDIADFQVHANQCLRPNVPWHPGGFWGTFWLGRGRPQMGPNLGGGCFNFSGHPATFAHEFGHYGFDLWDEYSDDDPSLRCTGLVNGSGPFGSGHAQASCMMWNEYAAGKLCSNRPENPHAPATDQGDSCWHHVGSTFGANDGRWAMRTPDTRSAIPGTLPDQPWTTWVVRNDYIRPDLCNSNTLVFQLTSPNMTPIPNSITNLRTTYGAEITQGRTDAGGNITIRGGHIGDTVKMFVDGLTASTTILPADCAPVAALVSAAPKPRQLVATPVALSLTTTVEPTPKSGEFLLRVRNSAQDPLALTASLTPGGGRDPRNVVMSFDPRSGSYIGTATGLPTLGQLTATISASDNKGRSAQQTITASLAPSPGQGVADLTSVDGHFTLRLAGGALPAGSNLTIGPAEVAAPKSQPDAQVLEGPYTVLSSSGSKLGKPAVVRFHLSSPDADPSTFKVRRYDPQKRTWEALKTVFIPGVTIVTAHTDRLGAYVLTARPAKRPAR
jgi:hypothetical protein